MGEWTTPHCEKCLPPSDVRGLLDFTIRASPKRWKFQELINQNCIPIPISPLSRISDNEWIVVCFIPENNFIGFSMEYTPSSNLYKLRVEGFNHQMVRKYRTKFNQVPPFDLSRWISLEGDWGKTFAHIESKSFDEISDCLLEAIDGVDENNWINDEKSDIELQRGSREGWVRNFGNENDD